jgi:hypothetical protein
VSEKFICIEQVDIIESSSCQKDDVDSKMLRYRWLFDGRTDLLLFFAPALVGLSVFLLLQDSPTSLVWNFLLLQGLGLGPFHLGASWFHLDDAEICDELIGFGKKKLIVLSTIAAIAAFSIVGMFVSPDLVIVLYLATTMHHIVRQNVGITLLYHNQGSEAVPDRDKELRPLYLSTWFCACAFIARNSPHDSLKQTVFAAGATILLFFVFWSIAQFVQDIRGKLQLGLPLNVPALLFWFVSVLFFLPVGFLGRDFSQALIIPLVMHWFQYVGLNWVLVRRKGETGGFAMSKGNDWRKFVAVSLVASLLVVLPGIIVHSGHTGSVWQKLWSGVMFFVTFIHYVQDAFLWRFRNPVLRRQMLAFLKPQIALRAAKTDLAALAKFS